MGLFFVAGLMNEVQDAASKEVLPQFRLDHLLKYLQAASTYPSPD